VRHGIDARCHLLLLHASDVLLHDGVPYALQLLRITQLLVSVCFKRFVLAAFVAFVGWLGSLGSLRAHLDVPGALVRGLVVDHLLLILRIILVHFVYSGSEAVSFDFLDALGAWASSP